MASRSSFGLLGFHPSALKQPDDYQTKVTNYAHKDFFGLRYSFQARDVVVFHKITGVSLNFSTKTGKLFKTDE